MTNQWLTEQNKFTVPTHIPRWHLPPQHEKIQVDKSKCCTLMKSKAFDRSEHVYKNDAFAELVKDAIRFFNGTPVHTLPPPESFLGTGVYAIYYTGKNPVYKKYAELNRLSYSYPIYVGKAVPKGWRQARASDNQLEQSKELISRLREHSRSIHIAQGLELQDFRCRFVIFEDASSDMISTILSRIKNHFKNIERKP